MDALNQRDADRVDALLRDHATCPTLCEALLAQLRSKQHLCSSRSPHCDPARHRLVGTQQGTADAGCTCDVPPSELIEQPW